MAAHKIQCPKCGKLNRIQRYAVRRIPRCGYCHAKLPEPWAVRAFRTVYSYNRKLLIALALVFVAAVVFERLHLPAPRLPPPPPVTLTTVTPPPDSIKHLPDLCASHDQPVTELYQVYDNSRPFLAPLTITVPSDANYFVVIEDAASGEPVESYFIRAGGTINDRAPLGSFILRYATGHSWCGADQLFGPETATGETETGGQRDILTFSQRVTTDGYSIFQRYVGQEITLIPQLNGNLRTRPIPREKFWHG